LASPYIGLKLDLRPFDRIAGDARPASLDEWGKRLEQLLTAVRKKDDPDASRMGIRENRLAQDVKDFQVAKETLSKFDGDKTCGEWIALTQELVNMNTFRFRQRLCRVPNERYDIVRLDQRGV